MLDGAGPISVHPSEAEFVYIRALRMLQADNIDDIELWTYAEM